MKIVCISDMHSMYRQIEMPDGDVLVVAGDILGHGIERELLDFNDWLGELPYQYKLVVAGNHDWIFQQEPDLARSIITNGTYLQDESVVVDGLKFYGSPWQPEFFDWAFNLPRGQALSEKWAMIPDDTDVLITHGPPHGILDETMRGENVGCDDLFDRVMQLNLKLHVFGHIHYCHGEQVFLDTHYVNAAICTEQYRPNSQPIVVEI